MLAEKADNQEKSQKEKAKEVHVCCTEARAPSGCRFRLNVLESENVLHCSELKNVLRDFMARALLAEFFSSELESCRFTDFMARALLAQTKWKPASMLLHTRTKNTK